jgi:hypothetical protein
MSGFLPLNHQCFAGRYRDSSSTVDEATGALVLAGIFTAFGGKEGTGVGSWSRVCSGQRVFKEISSES